MNAWRRALRNLEQHLEEVVGMDDAAALVNGFDQHVTNDHLDRTLDRAFDLHAERMRAEFRAELDQLRSEVARLPDQLAARWRRDLLIHSSVQLTALIAVVAALIALL